MKTGIRRRDWRDNKTRNPKETENIDEKNLSHLIFWCYCCHETKVKKQGKKEQQKTRKVTKWNKRRKGKKNKTKRERERETESEKEKWMKPRREKGRHREMNKNNPFSGGTTVFCKQTNKKQKNKFRANCPKTYVQGCVNPNSRRKRRKEQNTKGREKHFKRSLFKFAKTVSKEEPRKTRKNHPHRSRKQISGNGPTRTQTATELRAANAPKISQIGPRPGKMGKTWKTSFSKPPQLCSPKPFFAFQTQSGQKFELPKKNKFVRPPKLFSKKSCNIEAIQRVQCKWTRYQNTKLLRNPLFWSVSLPTTSWAAPRRP